MDIVRNRGSKGMDGCPLTDAYTNEFRELVALSGYMDPIAIILKFHRGLHPTTQDKIA
jgi:hypothetical protein